MTNCKMVISFLVIFLLGIFSVNAQEMDLAPNSKSAYLIDFETGEVMYQKNELEELAPASMTKIMKIGRAHV